METENKRKTRLQKLSGSDFEIVEGQPDIRGWDVKDSLGQQLGEVEELIFDYETQKVRYLVVDLEDDDIDTDADDNEDEDDEKKEVLVPIGIAELHENDDDVILPGVTLGQLRSLPAYDEDNFDTEHEASVRNVFGGLGGAALSGDKDDFYNHEHFNDANLYRTRTRGMVNEGSTTNTSLSSDESTSSESQQRDTGSIWLRSREWGAGYEDATLRDRREDYDENGLSDAEADYEDLNRDRKMTKDRDNDSDGYPII
ncbi:MAG: PRC-barrel domain-containing protein [Ferruginibacter sp.]